MAQLTSNANVTLVYDRVRDSYDRVAEHYAVELSDELAGKPVDRALLSCLAELAAVTADTTGPGAVADLGCGPGHVAAHLAKQGLTTIGVDLSPAMIEVGRRRHPAVEFRQGSLLRLPITDGELVAAMCFYAIIHLDPRDRSTCYSEFARVIRRGGWLLLAFHVGLVGKADGGIMHVDEWWGEQVDLDFYHPDPVQVADGLAQAGFEVMARTDREPWPGTEHASRRCYLLAHRT